MCGELNVPIDCDEIMNVTHLLQSCGPDRVYNEFLLVNTYCSHICALKGFFFVVVVISPM